MESSNKSLGLLRKANLLNTSKKLAFLDFITANKLKNYAVFSLGQNGFSISSSYNLDFQTIIKSKSSLDFWKGTVPEVNKVYLFKKIFNETDPFNQFFSENINSKINYISIYRSETNIILLINQNITQSLVSSFENIDFTDFKEITKSNTKVILDFAESIETLKLQYKLENTELNTLKNELQNRMYMYFNNVEKTGEYSFNVYLNEKNIEGLSQHLIYNLKDLLLDSSALLGFSYIED